ncbi:hypothetical protein [Massilia arenae]|uniref:Uncharacterized protein n=1 Tax=Massilia arenae TaxID=2603288 RepID=A0A5C7G752_9BURK|nr:hypothetical protein [Massilia arenae]TXG01868.1 hypothetical protein FVD38_01410 [Massilia arenae]
MTIPSARAFQSIISNYDGLGKSPLGLRLQKIVPSWSDRLSNIQLKDFVQDYAHKHANGRPIESVASEIGFDCQNKEEKTCNYEGIYTYDLKMPGSPDQRAAIEISVILNYSAEPWEIHGSRKFLYGGIEN